jgi:aspartate aminotransferase-like enzyme
MIRKRLFTPGPTPIPPEALAAMARPIIYHRSPEFEEVLAEVREGLKLVFQTASEVILLAASGTGAMEAAAVNTLARGDKALVIRGGKFGERWGEICAGHGIPFEAIDVEWGRAVDPGRVADALGRHPEIRAVLATHSETSTGVLHDLQAIADVVRPTPAVLIADCVTSLGVTDVPTDAWGLDVVVAGSQKALMIPPGLAFCALSQKAWAAAARSDLPKFYFNLAAEKKSLLKNQNAFTPAVSLVVALRETLARIRAEGLPHVIARHERLAAATRAGVQALGCELFAERPTPAATAATPPAGISASALVKSLRADHGITIAGGQDRLKGKIFRISHMGCVDGTDIVAVLGALERSLARLGAPIRLGDGVRAAQEILLK